jgi:hypothetical protein
MLVENINASPARLQTEGIEHVKLCGECKTYKLEKVEDGNLTLPRETPKSK